MKRLHGYFRVVGDEFKEAFKDKIGEHNGWDNSFNTMHIDENIWDVEVLDDGSPSRVATYKITKRGEKLESH